jgi:ketosteroid isomerase-like protein
MTTHEAAASTRPLHTAQSIFAAFDAQDVAGLAAMMADDVRLQLGNSPVVAGKPEFVKAVEAFLGSVASFSHSIVNVWSDGDALIAELEVGYTRLDGKRLTLPCCNVFRIRNGLVSDYRSYMDITPVYA